MSANSFGVALIGARGYVGREVLDLVAAHPRLELTLAASRALAGQPVPGHAGIDFTRAGPADVAADDHDVTILALPNEKSAPYVAALRESVHERVVVDLSGDRRFDPDWHYGLPELNRAGARDARWISNPGCYATGMQLAAAPIVALLDGPAQFFGVSGYSGAGTTPSPRNDPEALADNLLAYSPIGHLHEREVSHRLGIDAQFMPHVAAFFRGILITANFSLREPLAADSLRARYAQRYADEPLVDYIDSTPDLRQVRGAQHAVVGGCAVAADGRRVVVHCCLDNLLKGAATQALQNINLALGLSELEGIRHGHANLG